MLRLRKSESNMNKEQFEQILKSLERIGFNDAVGVEMGGLEATSYEIKMGFNLLSESINEVGDKITDQLENIAMSLESIDGKLSSRSEDRNEDRNEAIRIAESEFLKRLNVIESN